MVRGVLSLVLWMVWLGLTAGIGFGQPRAATYWGLEGWFGHDCGHLSYVDGQGVLHEGMLKNSANGGKTPGKTLQYATFYNGKIYAVSKQTYGGAENRLIRVDPSTWAIEQMGGAGFEEMEAGLQTYHFLGINDRLAYLSSNGDALYRVNLADMSVAEVEDGWDDAELKGIGTMVLYRGRIVVEVFGLTERALWVLNVETGAVEGKFLTKGLTDPLVTRDGRLLALRLGKDGGKKVVTSLVELNVDDVAAAPREVLRFDPAMRPVLRGMWSLSPFFASARAEKLYWLVSEGWGSKRIAMLDLGAQPAEPKVVYSGSDNFYGVARENPHDGSLWVNVNGAYGPSDRLIRLVGKATGEYAVDAEYVTTIQYGFASHPFFEDRHGAEVAESGREIKCESGATFDLCDLVRDQDGFSVSVVFSGMQVEGTGWSFALEKDHLLRVKSVGKGGAKVSVKAYSNGRCSELTFGFVDPLRQEEKLPLGVRESELLAGVAAVPNPCVERLQLRGAAMVESWQVYGQQGRKVAEGEGTGSAWLEIPAADWAEGVYYVRLLARDGARVVRVVKQ